MLKGKHTVQTLMRERNLTRQSAINLFSKLKKQGKVTVSGGGKQKRIYTITSLPTKQTNGVFDVLNKYNEEKLHPQFQHYVHGNYQVEQAIVDAVIIGDIRTLQATKRLFNHIKDWKTLADLAKQKGVWQKIKDLYSKARQEMRVRKMPERYQ